jgi:hypothetical protein
MAHFKIVLPNGSVSEWKKSDYRDAFFQVGYARDGDKFFLKNKEVTRELFNKECENLCDAWYERKCKTYKEVRVLHGSSVACYVTKWVKI